MIEAVAVVADGVAVAPPAGGVVWAWHGDAGTAGAPRPDEPFRPAVVEVVAC